MFFYCEAIKKNSYFRSFLRHIRNANLFLTILLWCSKMTTEMDMQLHDAPKELIDAYKSFGCEIISGAFDVLQMWGQRAEKYNQTQLAEILNPATKITETEVYEIYSFFYATKGPSQLDSLVNTLELQLDPKVFVQKAIPLLKACFQSVNQCRHEHGLPSFRFPKLT